jgi:hypothetical protein
MIRDNTQVVIYAWQQFAEDAERERREAAVRHADAIREISESIEQREREKMSEQNDTAEIIKKLDELAGELTGDQFVSVIMATSRIKQLQEKLTAIEQANADRSAITERYYQQAVEETRDFGDD